jgi:hypothetical protein
MADEASVEQLRQELRDIEVEIANLRGATGDVRAHVGPEGDGVEQSEDIATDLTSIQENEAVVGVLEQRRDALRQRLDALGA